MAPKKIIACQILGIGILVGFGVWLFVAFGSVSGQITCFLDQIDVMKTIKGAAGKETAKLASMIPASVTNLVRTYLPLLAVLVVMPAALIAVIELLVVFCASNPCKNSRMDEVCAKLLILLLQIFLIIGLICYLVLGGAGIAINTPAGQDNLKAVTTVCDVGIPQLASELAKAQTTLDGKQADLDAAPAGAPNLATLQQALTDAKFEIGEAQKSVAAMGQVCTCVKDTFALLATFVVPGLGCAAGCLVLMVLNCAACCALGICGGKKKKKDSSAEMVSASDKASV